MKWDVKHDRAKKIIDEFLNEAGNWQERADLAEGLNEEERSLVNEELILMITSIRKRYKLDVKLPQNQPESDKTEIPTEKQEETEHEAVNKLDTAEKAEEETPKPKKTRKTAGEKKAPARKPRAKKTEKEAAQNEEV